MATAIEALRHPIAEPSDANPSGVQPMDLRVVIRPDPVETRTKGGIILPDTEVDKEKWAATKGTLVAVGENAFHEAARNPGFGRPKAGDRVMYAKYGGVNFKGADGEEYRIMNDEDVIGRLIGE